MELYKHYLTKNDCYKTGKRIALKGIVVHSTGCNNRNVTRYVDIKELGAVSSNHWNKGGIEKCVNAFVGWSEKLKKAVVVQTLPDNMRPWGCGKGSKGSYNNSHFQFEICEDAGKDRDYFEQVWDLAVNLCTTLCKRYGWTEKVIVSHNEAHERGYGSNHGDADSYFKNFGKTMNDFRADVKKKLNNDNNKVNVVDHNANKNNANKNNVNKSDIEGAKHKNNKYKHTYVVNANDGHLMLRAGAGTNKAVVAKIPTGKTVKCYGYYNLANGDVWLLVVYDKLTGYVHSGYLKVK